MDSFWLSVWSLVWFFLLESDGFMHWGGCNGAAGDGLVGDFEFKDV